MTPLKWMGWMLERLLSHNSYHQSLSQQHLYRVLADTSKYEQKGFEKQLAIRGS